MFWMDLILLMIQNSKPLLVLTLRFAPILFLPRKMFYYNCKLEASPGCETRSPIPPTIKWFWHQPLLALLLVVKPLWSPLRYFRGLLCCRLVGVGRALAGPSVAVAALLLGTLVRSLPWGQGCLCPWWSRIPLTGLLGSTHPFTPSAEGVGPGSCSCSPQTQAPLQRPQELLAGLHRAGPAQPPEAGTPRHSQGLESLPNFLFGLRGRGHPLVAQSEIP